MIKTQKRPTVRLPKRASTDLEQCGSLRKSTFFKAPTAVEHVARQSQNRKTGRHTKGPLLAGKPSEEFTTFEKDPPGPGPPKDFAEQTLEERHRHLRDCGVTHDTWLAKYIFHPRFETFGGCVVLFNFMIMTMETHATATKDSGVLSFVSIVNFLLLLYYTAECGARLHAMRTAFFRAAWNNLDFVIVSTGWISQILETLQLGGSGMEQIAMLKSLRMLRLLRLVRLLVAFRELYVLVAGIGRCMKTLFWASGLIVLVLNVWAILSVEYLDDRVNDLLPSGVYDTCSYCENAFSNIWYANLTWFQIVSTADWATIGRPLAEEFIYTYLFFVANIFIVTYGLLNLIVAAIVDANIAAREDDIAIAAKMAARNQHDAWQSFADICEKMDKDGSGDISIGEFKEFWRHSDELQQHLTIMGVQESDMDQLLQVMDEDGSGTLEQGEFIDQFTQMRTLVEKTTLFFLLKFVQNIQAGLSQQQEVMRDICADVADMKRLCGDATPRSVAPSIDTVNAEGTANHEDQEAPSSLPSVLPVVKTLPPGWYYFGNLLPAEASVWCKEMSKSEEALLARMSAFARASASKASTATAGEDKLNDVSNATSIAPAGQHWEPLPCPNISRQDDAPLSDALGVELAGIAGKLSPLQADALSGNGNGHMPHELQDDLATKQDPTYVPGSIESEAVHQSPVLLQSQVKEDDKRPSLLS